MTRHGNLTSKTSKPLRRIGLGIAGLALTGTALVVANTASADTEGRIPAIPATAECAATLPNTNKIDELAKALIDKHLIDDQYPASAPNHVVCKYQVEVVFIRFGRPPTFEVYFEPTGEWGTQYALPASDQACMDATGQLCPV
jgi:hypothetical protein